MRYTNVGTTGVPTYFWIPSFDGMTWWTGSVTARVNEISPPQKPLDLVSNCKLIKDLAILVGVRLYNDGNPETQKA